MKFIQSLSVGTILSSLLFATAVQAQSVDAGVGADTDVSDGDIVVTATKRSERINSIGVAITAATGDDLKALAVSDVSALTRIEPSLQFSPSNNGTPVYTIRGVGYFEQSLAATPAVSLYQDEVPFTYPVMTRGVLMDVERVEILKGPQGTLYGQNATGGLVNFIAARPTAEFQAGVNGSIGRFNATTLGGFVSGPLSETLGVRVSAQIEQGGAWQRSTTRDDKLGDRNTKIGRLILEWNPATNFKAVLNLNGWTDNSETQAGQLVGYRFLNPEYLSVLAPGQIGDPSTFLPQPGVTYPQGIQDILANPIPGRSIRAADWVAGTHPRANQDFVQASLRLDYEFSDTLGLTTLSSYQRFTQDDVRDVSGISVANQVLNIKGRAETFFQEIRLRGESGDARLRWIIGGNYSHDTTRERDDVPFSILSSGYLTGGSPASLLPFAPWDNYFITNNVAGETLSAFANVDFDITERLVAHAGIRYTDSRQRMNGCTGTNDPSLLFFFGLLIPPGATPAGPGQCTTILADGTQGLSRESLNEDNIPFHVGLDFKIDPNSLLYLSLSKGYKAGTAPALVPTSYIQRTPVTQESLLAYEAGFKLGLFDRQLQLNGALFHYDYRNKQLLGRIIDPVGIFGALQALVNVPKSRENGAELTAQFRPVAIRGLTVDAAVTFLDSKVTSHFINYASYSRGPADTIDFFGEPYPYTPRWSLRGGARYEWSLSNAFNASLGADASYQTRMTGAFGAFKSSAEGPSLLIKPYALLNLGAGIEAADGSWRVDIWGKNVTSTRYWNTAFYQTDTTVRYMGMPATYGVSFSAKF